ncbi:MAG: hypothetical protein L0216_02805 [Planctomycetales bacterium]|nr:hypothetical protein [Planctomycetales bacterium]
MKATAFVVAAAALLGAIGCGKGSWTKFQNSPDKQKPPSVPYLVNERSEQPTVNLWRDAERSDKMPIARVAKGTRCKIVGSKELEKWQGSTMYQIVADTGESGWVPHFCIEFRHR